MALSVQTLVYLPSLSSRLLLRNIPNFSHYSSLSAMSLSSRNRSNSKAFRHILPRVAPVCEDMHYHKTGVPWHTKSTRMLIISPFKRRFPATICSALRSVNSSLCIGHFCTENANLSKILQDVYSNRSRNGVKVEEVTTTTFLTKIASPVKRTGYLLIFYNFFTFKWYS